MDITILAAVIESLRCPLCKQGLIVFEEDQKSKMGLASLFILKCTTRKVLFSQIILHFWQYQQQQSIRSEQKGCFSDHKHWRRSSKSHEICLCNKHVAITENAYRDHVQAVHDAAERIAKESVQSCKQSQGVL